MSSDLVFQAIAWHAEDFDFTEIDQEEDKYLDHSKYTIKCFGNTADGKTVSVTIKNFTPYFYVRIDESWDRTKINGFIEDISTLLPNHLKGSLVSVKFMKRKDFWGFTNFREFPFVRICLKNIKTMRFLTRKLSDGCIMKKSCGMRTSKFKIYESNIDPYIRFMHCKDIDPCGWIRISSGKYTPCEEVLPTHCDIDVETKWQSIEKYECVDTAPFLVASFDIECMSLSGDFPVPKKDYKTLASDLYELYYQGFKDSSDEVRKKFAIENAMFHAFNMSIAEGAQDKVLIEKYVRKLDPKFKVEPSYIRKIIKQQIDDIFIIVLGKPPALPGRDKIIGALNAKLSNESLGLPELKGDSVIQIGTTFHKYGAKECFMRHIVTLGSCDPIGGVIVESCETEEELLLKWRDLIIRTNPDILTGYNIFGFDMLYMYERANDLGIAQQFMKLGRFKDRISAFKEAKLSSSALGDNFLKYVAMEGRVLIDLMKVIQRDHKLDSYKLDNVASHFMKMNKKDVSPKDIFRLQLGSAQDRMVIADYCIQDCALCNHLMMKLEIIANNMGMANVCLVPLEFIFMRGQGIKIFSLVLKQCKDDGLLIPVVRPAIKKENPEEGAEGEEEEESYEGAIVLEPKEGIYIDDPVSVLDYASLYPSSMISENLSHDCIVNDPAYDNLPGVEYLDVCYDEYEGVGDKKRKKGVKTVKFVQLPNGEKGIIPRILMKLLKARKTTRKKIGMNLVKMKDGRVFQGFYNEEEHTVVSMESGDKTEVNPDEIESVEDYYNEFQKAVLDGLQNAYKVTANSLYGQIGARTSPIYLKDIAACTTATGRKMILMVKDFLEKNYGANVIYGDSVTGDTPLLIKYKDNTIDIVRIDELSSTEWTSYDQFKPNENGLTDKQQAFTDAEIWSYGHWAKINRVIRHYTDKKIYRVNTFQGCGDMTADHSLVGLNGELVKPLDCVIDKTEIKHSFPTEFPESQQIVKAASSNTFYTYNKTEKLFTCCRCKEEKEADEFYFNKKGSRQSHCKLCIKNQQLAKKGKPLATSVNKKVLNYNIAAYTLTKEEAWVWGFFFGDGSCGHYECESGAKRSWALNNSNLDYLNKALEYLAKVEPSDIVTFKILDTMKSSAVYKLVPVGSSKYMVEKYRDLFYDKEAFKKVPKEILNAPFEVRKYFLDGYLAADGSKTKMAHGGIEFACKGKIGAQGLFYIAKSIGWKYLRVNTQAYKDNTYWINNISTLSYFESDCNKVKKIYDVEELIKGENIKTNTPYFKEKQYVYDIETDCGMFLANVGSAIYRNTDSIFTIFPNKSIEATIDIPHEVAQALKGKSKIVPSIQTAIAASKEFKQHIKPPHDAEYEKTFWPFILLSKKRYVGNLYEMDDKKFKQKSMGIVLKRRDNAPIVKHIYGGIIDIILSKQDIGESIRFLKKSLDDLVGGKSPLEDLVITKSLRAEYKDPTRIAHKVLAERIGERDPGNKPQVNDRIPFVYIQQPPPTSKNTKILQGERIEHPDYIREHKLKPDYTFYITNQIMKPVLQVYGIVAEQVTGIKNKKTYYEDLYAKCAKEHKDDIKKIKDKYYGAREADVKEALFEPILLKLMNKNKNQTEITSFFKVGG